MKMTILALAAAGVALATLPAQAAVVDFENESTFRCDYQTPSTGGGMKYVTDSYACYYSPSNPADFPTRLGSTVMASGYGNAYFKSLTGEVFSLNTVDFAFGPFQHSGLTTDTATITGFLAGGGTVSKVIEVGYGFQTYSFNWTGLESIQFGQLANSEYLAFDNIAYNAGNSGVPEPAAWALMLAGFGLVGASMRRRETGVVAAA